jgi:asparagine synthase (glutamine-hydrolysing)
MCGLLGIGGPRGAELVRQLLPCLRHRGPDGQGVRESPELTIGHRRLAIIGLDEGGLQPMWSRSRDSFVVLNGEIYNYLELADRLETLGRRPDRRYDTAVLVEALEEWGIDALAELNGMFALAWYRPGERKLLLARDRFGEKPLFWGPISICGAAPVLVFSSELVTFARLPGGPPPPDPLGIVRYLVYDGMPDERTVYAGVRKLAAASWLECDPEGNLLRRGTFWRFHPNPAPTNPEEAGERALEDLSGALRLRLRSDVPVGLFLSGGMDSSILGALWRRACPGVRIRTFTVGFEDPSYDERRSARLLAESIGADHHETVATGADLERELEDVWNHLSEPFGDPSIVPTSLLCRFARGHVKVALGGDGGDEIQAGYDPFRAWKPARVMESVLPRRLWPPALGRLEKLLPMDDSNMSARFKLHHFAQGFLHTRQERIQGWMASFPLPLALAALRPELADEIDPESVLEPTRRAFDEVLDRGAVHAQINVWLKTYLESSILTKLDRASMMHSLEARAPYLDPAVVETMTNLPASLIFRNGRGKYLLRRAASPLLPKPLLRKPKKGFGVPQARWLRTILRERMEEALRRNRTGGWLRPEVIETMWSEHLAGRDDHRRALWNFLFSFPFQAR